MAQPGSGGIRPTAQAVPARAVVGSGHVGAKGPGLRFVFVVGGAQTNVTLQAGFNRRGHRAELGTPAQDARSTRRAPGYPRLLPRCQDSGHEDPSVP